MLQCAIDGFHTPFTKDGELVTIPLRVDGPALSGTMTGHVAVNICAYCHALFLIHDGKRPTPNQEQGK